MSEQTPEVYYCGLKTLPPDKLLDAARKAIEINPRNYPARSSLADELTIGGKSLARKDLLALLTSKYWGADGVHLAVGFIESVASDLRDRILSHMNAWGQFGNVVFKYTQNVSSAQVRITLEGGGYWSYLGTDILSISSGEPTMSLQGFNMNTSESEYKRVVRHETGHTLGFPHEHLRRDIIARLDVRKVISWGRRVLGWDEQTMREQVLTPLEDSQIVATPAGDTRSIMCYSLPAEVTKDGQAIAGGTDIDQDDQAFVSKVYPGGSGPIVNPEGGNRLVLATSLPAGSYKIVPLGAQMTPGTDQAQMHALDKLRPEGVSLTDWAAFIQALIEALLKLFVTKPTGPQPK